MTRKSFFVKTVIMIIASVVILTVGIIAVTAVGTVSEQNDTGERFLPEIGGFAVEETPKPQLSLAEKFGVYTTVYREDGKTVADIYSDEQIYELNEKRYDREALLSSEEVLYLINDTISLFSSCDLIRIRTTDGDISLFGGFKEMLTEEFIDSIGAFGCGNRLNKSELTDTMFLAIVERLLPLHYAIYYDYSSAKDMLMLLTDIPNGFSKVMINSICNSYINGRDVESLPEETSCGMFCLSYSGTITYSSDISNIGKNYATTVFSESSLPRELNDPYTYMISKKGVVIDIWDMTENVKVKRICLSDNDNADEIEKIEKLWSNMTIRNTAQASRPDDADECKYIACVFFKGITPFSGYTKMNMFYYLPESDPDRFGFNFRNKPFDTICISGSRELAEYLNEIIAVHIDF